MVFSKVTAVYFSPAGSTRQVARHLAGALARALGLPWQELDITLPSARSYVYTFSPDELTVFASPTYAGRLPNKMRPYFISGFRAHGAAAVPVVLFGNRSFQDALSELSGLLQAQGFVPVGAASVPARHVFSDKIAPDRPSADDLAALDGFARRLADSLQAADSLRAVTVPGNDPPGPYYTPLTADGQPAKFLKATPRTTDACTGCGRCAQVCPMGSIDPHDCSRMLGVCIKCQACVRACPEGARYFDDPAFLSHVAMLEENYTAPQPLGLYL